MKDNIGSLSNLSLIDIHSKQKRVIGVNQLDNDMIYEIQNFVKINNAKNIIDYIGLKKVSRDVLSITETARKQKDIVFSCEK